MASCCPVLPIRSILAKAMGVTRSARSCQGHVRLNTECELASLVQAVSLLIQLCPVALVKLSLHLAASQIGNKVNQQFDADWDILGFLQ
jgi:hypothetical protein